MNKKLKEKIADAAKSADALRKEIDDKLTVLAKKAYAFTRCEIPMSVLDAFDNHPEYFTSRKTVVSMSTKIEIPISKPLPIALKHGNSLGVDGMPEIFQEMFELSRLREDI